MYIHFILSPFMKAPVASFVAQMNCLLCFIRTSDSVEVSSLPTQTSFTFPLTQFQVNFNP